MLAAAFIEGAESAGKSVTLFRTADLKIGGCMGCGHCFKEKGVCVQKDDMLPILDAIRNADALVLASPIYYWGVSAQLKLAVDRMYPLLSVNASVQRVAMLLTCGNKNANVNEGVLFMLSRLCRAYGWDNAGVITAAGLHGMGEIAGRGELEEARALGRGI
jgi:multimeric flavodoxin WrbA